MGAARDWYMYAFKKEQIMDRKKYITTIEMCSMIGGIKPQSVHRSLSMKGNWAGIRPTKLHTGRLMWSLDDVVNVLNKKY